MKILFLVLLGLVFIDGFRTPLRPRLRTSLVASFQQSPQYLSIGAGVGGIIILLGNRLSVDMERITDVQSRADIISVVACSALLLNALSEQDIVARERDPVALVGYALKSSSVDDLLLSASQQTATHWYIRAILQCTPATSVHVVRKGLIVGVGGVIGQGKLGSQLVQSDGSMPILHKVARGGEEVYLPDLQILPGKVEFTYLPINAQSVLLLPSSAQEGAIIIATNQAKVLKLADLARLRALTAVYRKIAEETTKQM